MSALWRWSFSQVIYNIIYILEQASRVQVTNYHTVTAGPVPPLVVLIHTRGRQGWRAAVCGRECCHLLRSASPPPPQRWGDVGTSCARGGAFLEWPLDWTEVINIGSLYYCVVYTSRELKGTSLGWSRPWPSGFPWGREATTIWRALFLNAISTIKKKEGLSMLIPSSWIVFWKRAIYMCTNAYICTYLWSAFFQTWCPTEPGIGIAISIFGLALIAFWKRALLM